MHIRGTRGGRPLGWLVALLVLLATTYASGGAAAQGHTLSGVASGSRARAMFYDGGDGALLFRGWFDSELGVPCTFMRTRNGQMRCLPAGQLAVLSDSTCTTPVWFTPVVSSACRATLPRYVTGLVPQSGSAAAYPLGEPYTGAVRNTSAGICLDSHVRSGLYSYYGTGAEIPSERFVAATISHVPVDDGKLMLRTIQGDDGSWRVAVELDFQVVGAWRTAGLLPQTLVYHGSGRLRVPSYVDAHGQVLEAMLGVEFYDEQADGVCRPVWFADGLRCVPRTVMDLTEAGPYLDSGCTMLLSETRPASLWPPPASGALAVTRDCSGATAYALGDVVTPAVVYSKGSTCESKRPVAGAVYRCATPAGDSQWAPVTERVE